MSKLRTKSVLKHSVSLPKSIRMTATLFLLLLNMLCFPLWTSLISIPRRAQYSGNFLSRFISISCCTDSPAKSATPLTTVTVLVRFPGPFPHSRYTSFPSARFFTVRKSIVNFAVLLFV